MVVWDGTDKNSANKLPMNEVAQTQKETETNAGVLSTWPSASSCRTYAYCIQIKRDAWHSSTSQAVSAGLKLCPTLLRCLWIWNWLYYFATNAMLFGSVVPVITWKLFCWAIAALDMALYTTRGFVHNYWDLIQLVKWDKPPGVASPVAQAKVCALNPGVFSLDRIQIPTPPPCDKRENNLLADIRSRMYLTLAAAASQGQLPFNNAQLPWTSGKPCLCLINSSCWVLTLTQELW